MFCDRNKRVAKALNSSDSVSVYNSNTAPVYNKYNINKIVFINTKLITLDECPYLPTFSSSQFLMLFGNPHRLMIKFRFPFD